MRPMFNGPVKYPKPVERLTDSGPNLHDPAKHDKPPSWSWLLYGRYSHRPRNWLERILFGYHRPVEIVFIPTPLTKRQRRRQKGKDRG